MLMRDSFAARIVASVMPRQKNAFASRTIRTVPPRAPIPFAAAGDGAQWLGAYYVVDFGACGLTALPNTQGDATGWANNAAAYQQADFIFGDSDVKTEDFVEATDAQANAGVDSVIAAYIATHGARQGNQFVFVIGAQDGQCKTILNTDMTLGDGSLRYLFMSSCESTSKDDPGAVWFDCAVGLRAVFGYDGRIVDSPDYGQFFFDEWKKDGATTTQAFLDASWRISHDQSAVAVWFGADADAASDARDHEAEFQPSAVADQAIAFRWHGVDELRRDAWPGVFANMRLIFDAPAPVADALPLLRSFDPHAILPVPSAWARSGQNDSFRTQDGTLFVRNASSGSLDIISPRFSQRSVITADDASMIDAATAYIQSIRNDLPGIQTSAFPFALGLTPTALRRSYVASCARGEAPRVPVVTHLTVIFRQTVNGVATIGTGGVVEVTLNGDRAVCRMRMVMRDIAIAVPNGSRFTPDLPLPAGGPLPRLPSPPSFPSPSSAATLDIPALASLAQVRAVQELKSVTNTCDVIKTEFGFYAADEAQQQHTSEPSFRVLVEVTTGDYARRFDKIYAASDLG